MKFDFDDGAFESWVPERELVRPKPKKRKHKDFYSSQPWLELRQQVLDRYGKVCMRCGRCRGEMHVDHIKPRFYYPELALDFNNLQVLCWRCNYDKGISTCDYRPIKSAI